MTTADKTTKNHRATRNRSPSGKQGKKHLQQPHTFVIFVKLAPAHPVRASRSNVSRKTGGRQVRRKSEKLLDVSGTSSCAAIALFAFSVFCGLAAFWFLPESSASAPALIALARLALAVAYASFRQIAKKRPQPA
jgi:VIT1/CCC1 family predicted Fe2+/Mn2+ transporter